MNDHPNNLPPTIRPQGVAEQSRWRSSPRRWTRHGACLRRCTAPPCPDLNSPEKVMVAVMWRRGRIAALWLLYSRLRS